MASLSNQPSQNIQQNYPTLPHFEEYALRTGFFKAAMRRDWKRVLELYKQVQDQMITLANDTALHVAISGADQNTILKLLKVIEEENDEGKTDHILQAKNKHGDTPLHLAAALGLEKVCYKIALLKPKMVTTARNNLLETPLFTAVRHGKKNAFFVLETVIYKSSRYIDSTLTNEHLWFTKRDVSHCRRHDGNNILHYAIKGEQLDLAYDIIHIYPELVHLVNTSGQSALHTLANKPSVFKSGTRLGFYDTIIYYCTMTEPLVIRFHEVRSRKVSLDATQDEIEVLPQTYKVCIDLYSLIKKFVHRIVKTFDEYKTSEDQKHKWFPRNYEVPFSFFKIINKLLLVFLAIGLRRQQKIEKLKQMHKNASTIMRELVDQSKLWKYEDVRGGMHPTDLISQIMPHIELQSPVTTKPTNPSREGCQPNQSKEMEEESTNEPDTASPVLVAAKRGIKEMVQRILHKFPQAIFDQDMDDKNIVLLAVEHRQIQVYNFMLNNTKTMKESVFGQVDKEGNNALHLAAMTIHSQPWNILGAAFQMQWEIKWYKYVLDSMNQQIFATINNERRIFSTKNNKGSTAQEVFWDSHKEEVEEGRKWIASISQSCFGAAALVATVAFASISTIPGGVDPVTGFPIFGERPAFQLFSIASLAARCFSVISLVMFFAILSSRQYQVMDFEIKLPVKLFLGLTSLFVSVAFVLVSFCAVDFFVVEKKFKFVAYPIYFFMFLAIAFLVIGKFPIFIDSIKATMMKVPLGNSNFEVSNSKSSNPKGSNPHGKNPKHSEDGESSKTIFGQEELRKKEHLKNKISGFKEH